MISASAIFIVSGVICLLVSGYAMYHLMPRAGRPPSPWLQSELGETTMALAQFILLVAGLALLVKGLF
jgi:hypothetical protein